MKKIFIVLLFAFPLPVMVHAAGCVTDGGPACALGPAYDYSTVCSDGTIDHSVVYSTIASCRNITPQYVCPAAFPPLDKQEMQSAVNALQSSIDAETLADTETEANIKNNIYPIDPATADAIDKIKLSAYPANQRTDEINQLEAQARMQDQTALDDKFVSFINKSMPVLSEDKAIIAECPVTPAAPGSPVTPTPGQFDTKAFIQESRDAGISDDQTVAFLQAKGISLSDVPVAPKKETFLQKIGRLLSDLKFW